MVGASLSGGYWVRTQGPRGEGDGSSSDRDGVFLFRIQAKKSKVHSPKQNKVEN